MHLLYPDFGGSVWLVLSGKKGKIILWLVLALKESNAISNVMSGLCFPRSSEDLPARPCAGSCYLCHSEVGTSGIVVCFVAISGNKHSVEDVPSLWHSVTF